MGFFGDCLRVTVLMATPTFLCSAEMCNVLLPDNYSSSQPPISREGTPLVIDITLFVEDLLEINDAEMNFKISIKLVSIYTSLQCHQMSQSNTIYHLQ